MKKVFKWLLIIIVVIFAALVTLPFVFKDKIVAKVKEEANKNINAKVDFGDFDLSLIRSFPNLSLSIRDISVINLAPFEGDTLLFSKNLALTLDIMTVIKGEEIGIKSLDLEKPVMYFLVKENGKANWDIAKESGEAAKQEETAFKASLKRYSIKDGKIIYDDRSLDFYLGLNGLNHEGKGDFTQDLFILSTKSIVENARMSYEKIPYLNGVKTEILADIDMDMKNFRFAFKENVIKLNALEIGVNGYVAMPDTNIDMDLSFQTSKSDFGSFISLIPAVYSADFQNIRASGNLELKGFIKGRYNALSMPGFGLTLKADNGAFKYPSMTSEVKNVIIDLDIQNPDGNPDKTVINLSKMHVELDGDPFDARLLLKTPISDPELDAFVKGKVDLSKIQKLVPLEQGTKLSGLFTADLSANGRMSSIEKKQYESFNAAGNLRVQNLEFSSAELKSPFLISNLQLSFNPRNVILSDLQAKSGSSDFSMNGSLDNFIAYALKGDVLRGGLNLNSARLNLNEFMDEGEGSTADTDTVTAMLEVPGNVDFTLNASIGTLIYQDVNIFNVKGSLTVKDEMIRMSNLVMQLLDGSMNMSGSYSSKDKKNPKFDFDLGIRDFDIQKTVNFFPTVGKLAPLAKSCSGKYSAAMTVNGNLDQSMSPVMNSLNGGGKLTTGTIVVQNFPAFSKIADVLKMPSWKTLNIPPVNPSFKFMNGRVYVDPVDVSINGMKGKVAGSNGFDQTIDYTMAMEIPRSAFGGAANAVLNNMVSQANAKGTNISLGENVPVNLLVGGTVSDPKVSTDLRQQGANVMEDIKAKAREEIGRRKEEAEARAREEAEKLKKEAASKIEAEKDKAAAEAERIKKEAEAKAKAVADSIKKANEKKAKDELDKINPFKKK
ncbi:MAG: membrane assembly protein AsmA [Bacteroidetes bacterium]|nr:MAG: membrane assembly protein AsmA [Bacteroidota bacterium]REJ99928.1 MAG: membrane assembly protein AsmA [Bacteroidota bacterium]REK35892.1 MAG: membrane assembly protein AsmA [Bacteroidota bacterium]REK50631.1 MAG: membrane assembly protein AsmA [Bacteroidota bacterium]